MSTFQRSEVTFRAMLSERNGRVRWYMLMRTPMPYSLFELKDDLVQAALVAPYRIPHRPPSELANFWIAMVRVVETDSFTPNPEVLGFFKLDCRNKNSPKVTAMSFSQTDPVMKKIQEQHLFSRWDAVLPRPPLVEPGPELVSNSVDSVSSFHHHYPMRQQREAPLPAHHYYAEVHNQFGHAQTRSSGTSGTRRERARRPRFA